ncbi:MAG: hypothetical protein JSS49_10275 [Planctomycetes bacterium]|nr:hypothetical protein [Planctomycetota bacterium]
MPVGWSAIAAWFTTLTAIWRRKVAGSPAGMILRGAHFTRAVFGLAIAGTETRASIVFTAGSPAAADKAAWSTSRRAEFAAMVCVWSATLRSGVTTAFLRTMWSETSAMCFRAAILVSFVHPASAVRSAGTVRWAELTAMFPMLLASKWSEMSTMVLSTARSEVHAMTSVESTERRAEPATMAIERTACVWPEMMTIALSTTGSEVHAMTSVESTKRRTEPATTAIERTACVWPEMSTMVLSTTGSEVHAMTSVEPTKRRTEPATMAIERSACVWPEMMTMALSTMGPEVPARTAVEPAERRTEATSMAMECPSCVWPTKRVLEVATIRVFRVSCEWSEGGSPLSTAWTKVTTLSLEATAWRTEPACLGTVLGSGSMRTKTTAPAFR